MLKKTLIASMLALTAAIAVLTLALGGCNTTGTRSSTSAPGPDSPNTALSGMTEIGANPALTARLEERVVVKATVFRNGEEAEPETEALLLPGTRLYPAEPAGSENYNAR